MNFDVSGKLTNSGGGALVPIGCILSYCGTSIPDNWLYCAGLEVSRSEYSELFATIGTRFGAGNGSTTFNIPDLREKFIFGANPGTPETQSYTIGTTGGSKDAVVVSHGHTVTATFNGTNQTGYIEAFPPVANGRGAASGVFSNADSGGDYTYTGTSGNTRKITRFNFSMTPSGTISTRCQYQGESGTGKNMPPYACYYYIIRAK